MSEFDAIDMAKMPKWAKAESKITRKLKAPGILQIRPDDGNPTQYLVLDAKTGREFWLPRRFCIFVPGGVQLPESIHDKIFGKDS